ncbi:MAG: hypothetical protein AAF690_01250 [Acidobacteriota bacterium]
MRSSSRAATEPAAPTESRKEFVPVQLAVVLGAALPYLLRGRSGFASEDFVILRQLASNSFADLLRDNFTGPWLGLEMLDFYRPLSTLILKVLVILCGLDAEWISAVHALFHGACSLLIGRLVFRLLPKLGAMIGWSAAIVFAVHPLAPNTVAFIASFSTLYSTLFGLLALDVVTRRAALSPLAVALFAASMLCYEQAVVFPFLGAASLLLIEADARRIRWAWAVSVAVAVGYLAVRSLAVGAAVGGYESTRERLLAATPAETVSAILENAARVAVPSWQWQPSFLVLAVITLGVATWAAASVRSGGRLRELAVPSFGALWWAVCAAPFGFARIVPANARYTYMGIAGLVLLLCGLLGLSRRLAGRRASTVILCLLSLGYLLALDLRLKEMRAASALAARVADQTSASTRDVPLAVLRVPRFINGPRGEPVAQVLNWGLSDSLDALFDRSGRLTYPVDEVGARALGPAAGQGHLDVVRWSGKSLERAATAPLSECVESRLEGDLLTLNRDQCAQCRYRLVVLSPVGDNVLELRGESVALPADTMTTMRALWVTPEGDFSLPVLAWVLRGEAEDLCTSKVHLVLE